MLIVYFLNFFVVFMILVFVIEFHLIVLHWLTCCLRDVLISSGKFKMLSMKHGHDTGHDTVTWTPVKHIKLNPVRLSVSVSVTLQGAGVGWGVRAS